MTKDEQILQARFLLSQITMSIRNHSPIVAYDKIKKQYNLIEKFLEDTKND